MPFFFKQWGGVFKGKAGRELDGRTYDNYPEVPAKGPPSRRVRLRLLGELGGR